MDKKTEERIEKIKKEIEKEFLSIRGWKDWDKYDEVGHYSKADKNIRDELIDVCIKVTSKFTEKEFAQILLKRSNEDSLKWVEKVNQIKQQQQKKVEDFKDDIYSINFKSQEDLELFWYFFKKRFEVKIEEKK